MDIFRHEIEIPSYALLAETLKGQQRVLDERKAIGVIPISKLKSGDNTWFGKLYGY